MQLPKTMDFTSPDPRFLDECLCEFFVLQIWSQYWRNQTLLSWRHYYSLELCYPFYMVEFVDPLWADPPFWVSTCFSGCTSDFPREEDLGFRFFRFTWTVLKTQLARKPCVSSLSMESTHALTRFNDPLIDIQIKLSEYIQDEVIVSSRWNTVNRGCLSFFIRFLLSSLPFPLGRGNLPSIQTMNSKDLWVASL